MMEDKIKPIDNILDTKGPIGIAEMPKTETHSKSDNAAEERLDALADEIRAEEETLNLLSNNRTQALAFGIPLFFVSLAVIASQAGKFPAFNSLPIESSRVKVLLLWLLLLPVVLPVYYFIFHKRVVHATDRLNKKEETYIALRLSTIEGRKEYFREQLFRLSSKASRVFFDDEKRFAEASQFSGKAGKLLDDAQGTADLSLVQSYLNSQVNSSVARSGSKKMNDVGSTQRSSSWSYTSLGSG